MSWPQFEKALITRALAHTGGRRIEASQLLGLGRNTLTRKIQELGSSRQGRRRLDAGRDAIPRRKADSRREIRDDRRVIGRPLVLARLDVDRLSCGTRQPAAGSEEIWSMRKPILRLKAFIR